jgi:hypothetical protein
MNMPGLKPGVLTGAGLGVTGIRTLYRVLRRAG